MHLNMKNLNKLQIRYCKLLIASLFSFLLGCMFVLNIVPINKTCQVDNTDREYNIMKNSKLKDPDVIVLIMSAPTNLDKRTVIRETWLKLKSSIEYSEYEQFARHYFVIGSLGLTTDRILHLSTEQSRYNDMLILPMHDNYDNLTHKIVSTFIWLKDQLDVGLHFKYVLKCDDDSFVRLDSLAHELKQIEIMYLKSDLTNVNLNSDNTSPYLRVNVQANTKSATNKLQLYWGYFSGKASVQTSGKWKEDNWILCDNYIPYALGGGYILSKGLVKVIANSAEHLRYYKSEDVSVGAWLSSVNNILRIHDRRFDTEWKSRGCQDHHLISHNVALKDMQYMYNNIVTNGNMCLIQTVIRYHYLYNWTLPPSRCCSTKR